MKFLLAILFSLTVVLINPTHAGELLISKKGEPLLSDDFSTEGPLHAPWTMPKGKWEVKDGALWGSELKTDKHAAVLHYNKKNYNLIMEFDYELHGAKFLHLSFNHAKGHLWRLMISEKEVRLQKDKNKKDPNSKAEVAAKASFASKAGERHHVTVEIVGPQIVVRVDDKITLKASNPALDTQKPNIRFIVRGESVRLDNVKAWSAEAK
jgi:hypothetical protein